MQLPSGFELRCQKKNFEKRVIGENDEEFEFIFYRATEAGEEIISSINENGIGIKPIKEGDEIDTPLFTLNVEQVKMMLINIVSQL